MFEEWYLNDLMDKDVREIWPLTDDYLLKSLSNFLEKSSIMPLLKEGVTVSAIIEKNGYLKKVDNSIKWVLERLEFSGYIGREDSGDEIIYKWNGKDVDFDKEAIYEKCFAQDPNCKAAFQLIDLMESNYQDILTGNKTGVDVVFSPENIHIINDYYGKNTFYNANNLVGTKALAWEVDQRDTPSILEVGGGLGGGTKRFLAERKKDGKSLTNFKYHFTDVANKMIRTTKKVLAELTDDMSNFTFSKFDFNKSLEESKDIKENSYDIIWGVNAVHVGRDLKFTLEQIYKALKPGGSLLVAETVRPSKGPMIQIEFVLNALNDYWDVKLDEEWRPNFGFMTWADWCNALRAAGFDEVGTVPNMAEVDEEFSNCYAAVIKGVKK